MGDIQELIPLNLATCFQTRIKCWNDFILALFSGVYLFQVKDAQMLSLSLPFTGRIVHIFVKDWRIYFSVEAVCWPPGWWGKYKWRRGEGALGREGGGAWDTNKTSQNCPFVILVTGTVMGSVIGVNHGMTHSLHFLKWHWFLVLIKQFPAVPSWFPTVISTHCTTQCQV